MGYFVMKVTYAGVGVGNMWIFL